MLFNTSSTIEEAAWKNVVLLSLRYTGQELSCLVLSSFGCSKIQIAADKKSQKRLFGLVARNRLSQALPLSFSSSSDFLSFSKQKALKERERMKELELEEALQLVELMMGSQFPVTVRGLSRLADVYVCKCAVCFTKKSTSCHQPRRTPRKHGG